MVDRWLLRGIAGHTGLTPRIFTFSKVGMADYYIIGDLLALALQAVMNSRFQNLSILNLSVPISSRTCTFLFFILRDTDKVFYFRS
jgi:hypothetical protein